jgi:acetyl-CoA synthetase
MATATWYQGRADDVQGSRLLDWYSDELPRAPSGRRQRSGPVPDGRHNLKAFVVLAAGHAPSIALEEDIRQHVRKFLAPYEYPKEIEFIDALPMTTTGKVQRRVLREQERERKAAQAR